MTNTFVYPPTKTPNTWLNADGLWVRFGATAAADAKVSVISYPGLDPRMIIDIDYEWLPAGGSAATAGMLADFGYPGSPVGIASGGIIKSVEWVVTTAFTSATSAARLNVGLVNSQGQPVGTGSSNTAIVSARNVISDTTGATNAVTNGASFNAVVSGDLYPWLSVTGSENFTAGHGRLVVTYLVQDADTGE